MAIVIHAPLVGTDRRRPLPAESPESSRPAPGLVARVETDANATQEKLNQSIVERLTAEKNAEADRARLLEHELKDLREQLALEMKEARCLGYEEGLRLAKEQVLAEQAKGTEAIGDLLQSLAKEHLQLIDLAEAAAVEIGFAAAVKIMGQASVDHSLVVAMVKQATELVSAREGLVVHLSASDFRLIESLQIHKPEVNELFNLTFKINEQVGIGGCMIESRAGLLDARLELQIQELKRLLSEAGDKKLNKAVD